MAHRPVERSDTALKVQRRALGERYLRYGYLPLHAMSRSEKWARNRKCPYRLDTKLGAQIRSRYRTRFEWIFPNHDSCPHLIRVLAVETHEHWLEANRYLNMDYLGELKKEQPRKAP